MLKIISFDYICVINENGSVWTHDLGSIDKKEVYIEKLSLKKSC